MQSLSVSQVSTVSSPERVLLDALNASPDMPVLVLGLDGSIRETNARARTMLQIDETVRSIADVLPAAVAGELIKLVRQSGEQTGVMVVDAVLASRWLRLRLRSFEYEGSLSVLVLGALSHESPIAPDAITVRMKNEDAGPLGTLTPREMEILRLIALGLSTNEIAKVLYRSVKTIEGHRVSLGSKLDVTNRVELARIALRSGLITLDTPIPEIEEEPKD